jgi:hypothetical protein
MDRAWDEIHRGAELNIPGFYKFIIKYITPLFLLFILGFWFIQQALPTLMMKGVSPQNMPYIFGTRIGLIALFISIAIMVRIAYYRRKPS